MRKPSQPIHSKAAAQEPDDEPIFSGAILVLGGFTLGVAVIFAIIAWHL